MHWRFHVTVMCTCTCLCYLCLSLSTKLNEMPKRTTVRNGIRYERIPPTNPPLQKAKLATVQIQNDYRNHRHRQSKPAARRLQTTMHKKLRPVDTGATHHMVNMSFWLAFLVESYIQVAWGGVDSYSRALGIGHMVFTTYALRSTLDDKPPKQVLMTSGQADTLLVPDVSRPLAASNRWSAQGHTPHLQEMNPGLIGFETVSLCPSVMSAIQVTSCVLVIRPQHRHCFRQKTIQGWM